jgi:hypothetical protein
MTQKESGLRERKTRNRKHNTRKANLVQVTYRRRKPELKLQGLQMGLIIPSPPPPPSSVMYTL